MSTKQPARWASVQGSNWTLRQHTDLGKVDKLPPEGDMFRKTTKQHYEKYHKLGQELGVTLSHLRDSTFLGYTVSQLRLAFFEDPHLNNIPLQTWDNMAYAFLAAGGRGRGLSLAEAVCLYKHLCIYELIGATPEFNGG